MNTLDSIILIYLELPYLAKERQFQNPDTNAPSKNRFTILSVINGKKYGATMWFGLSLEFGIWNLELVYNAPASEKE
ncbi:hypothetical protein MUP29_05270 [bacterium]|nr:hypothetical protein [bacterium]